jgi:hypothetical protein
MTNRDLGELIFNFLSQPRAGRIVVSSGNRTVGEDAIALFRPDGFLQVSNLQGELPRHIRFEGLQAEASDGQDEWRHIDDPGVAIYRFLDPRTIFGLAQSYSEDPWDNKPGASYVDIRVHFDPFALSPAVSEILQRLPRYNSGGVDNVAHFSFDPSDGWMNSFVQNILPTRVEIVFEKSP